MSPFLSLETITDVDPWQVGETAQLLYQLKQSGRAMPNSWVIPAEAFQRSLQKLISREPIFADWPKLLWQTSSATGYPVQHLAKRLKRPLRNLPTDLPWAELTAQIESPVVRLLPSLWLGESTPTAPFAQMLSAPACWAEPESLESALKDIWASIFNAKSLAFWSQWAGKQGVLSLDYPVRFEVAVVVQSVEPALFSGGLTLRSPSIEIELIQGLPEAIAESCPDTYQGRLPPTPHFDWQPGYQEQRYVPNRLESFNQPLAPCLSTEQLSQSALDAIDEETAQALWTAIKSLSDWSERPLRVGWYLSETTRTLNLFHACWWPMRPTANSVTSLPHVNNQGIFGHAASPGRSCGTALVITLDSPLPASAHQQVVVATEVMPEWLPLLKTAVGVISEQGGLTCHAAVLARELGLPAIVGVTEATRHFRTGDILQIDGDRGLIQFLPELPANLDSSVRFPAITTESCQSHIWLNLSQPDTAFQLAELPVAGVGLLRSEWLMMPILDRQHPYRWLEAGHKDELKAKLLGQLQPILQAFFPRPVRYRTLDLRTNEFAQLLGAPPTESNPMLGVRGAFSYRRYAAFFRLELELLKELQDSGYTNLQLLLPFVRTVEEFAYCQELVRAVGLDRHPDFELWIMAEVPSVLFLLSQYAAAGVQGIAIGTHDLTQLLLGIDRDQLLFADYFDETHFVVSAAIAQLTQQARQLQLPCCLCGASPIHHPHFVESMLREGITSISVDAAALEVTVKLIQNIESDG